MKKTRFVFLLVLLIGVGVSSALAQGGAKADEQTAAFLRKVRAEYSAAMAKEKPDALAAYYADSVRLMPEFQKTVLGKSNALAYHKAFFGRFDVQQYSREEIEILDLGARVVELGTFAATLTLKTDGKKHELKGKYQNFWKRLPGGKLVLLTEAWNYSHQVGIADQLRFAQVPSVDVAMQAHLPINSSISFQLAALNRLMEATIAQHDAKIWAQFYADDAMFVYSNHPVIDGRKAIDAFLEKHVKEIPIFEKLDIRNDQVENLGDYVIEYASHIAIFRVGDFSGVNTGKNVTIWRREKDSSLKIFRGMAMYD